MPAVASPRVRVLVLFVALLVTCGYLEIPAALRQWLRSYSENYPNCKNVLFIGNSLTFVYDMPGIVSVLSNRLSPEQQRICPSREAYPGVTLQWHFEQGHADTRLAERHWDYVVIQEQSGRSFEEPELMQRWIEHAIGRINQAHSKALLYSISSRNWRDDQQAVLDQRMRTLAKSNNVTLVPVNALWQKALSINPTLRIFGDDNHHPGPFGAYLAAALFTKTITGHLPDTWPLALHSDPVEFRDLLFPHKDVLTQAELQLLPMLFEQY